MNVLFFTGIRNPRILSCSLSLGVRVEVFSFFRKCRRIFVTAKVVDVERKHFVSVSRLYVHR